MSTRETISDRPEGRHPGMELIGQVAIVTGAAGGLGACIAERLAFEGAAVVLADIDLAAAERVAAELTAAGLKAYARYVDVADEGSARSMAADTLAELGRIDILINNAAIDAPPGLPWSIDADHWRRVIDVDLTGQWWCTSAVIDHMIARGSGRIVFISSVSARVGKPGLSVAYNSAKAGLLGLTVGLAANLEGHGIRVNAVAPGPTGTGRPMSEADRTAYAATFPLGLGGAKPVADACAYLVCSSGDWVSGSVLNVSGGFWRG